MSQPPWTAWYAGKRAVVLGASGFLGRALTAQLGRYAGSVVAVSRGTATPVIPELHAAQIVTGDVTSLTDMKRAVDKADAVFVMAGVSGAALSWREPQRSLDINVGGMTNVLDALRDVAPEAAVVFPSSRLVYGASATLPVPEDAPLRPGSPYAAHKLFCERLLELYHERYGVRYAVARLTNPYGPSHHLPAQNYNVISTMIARARAGEELVVFGDGRQLRDYLFVDDAVAALAMLATFARDEVVNVGSGVGTRFVDVVNAIVEAAGSGSIAYRDWPREDAAVESGDFVADVTRARALGLPQPRGIHDGLRQTLQR